MSSEDTPRPFHERFDIDVGADEAKRRFINRVRNTIIHDWMYKELDENEYRDVLRDVATTLGEEHYYQNDFDSYIENDFYRCLRALEGIYEAVRGIFREEDFFEDVKPLEKQLAWLINDVIQRSEVDLGIRWQSPIFAPSGARFLDEHLVNKSLHWLSNPIYATVYSPFEKGLSHYLEAKNRPERLADVVTDMYEAIEALARVVLNNDRDLSRNREAFIRSLRTSDYYKQLLKGYVEYANQFRHAERQDRPRPPLSESEVEAFVYLTGLFIRLAIRQN